MRYPTFEEVEEADRVTLCRWHRFLPSPGAGAVNLDVKSFRAAIERETLINNRIHERYLKAGGMSPEISKAIGWDR